MNGTALSRRDATNLHYARWRNIFSAAANRRNACMGNDLRRAQPFGLYAFYAHYARGLHKRLRSKFKTSELQNLATDAAQGHFCIDD